jgi:hypothetical protein
MSLAHLSCLGGSEETAPLFCARGVCACAPVLADR